MTVQELDVPAPSRHRGTLDLAAASDRAAQTTSPLLLVVVGRSEANDLVRTYRPLEQRGWVVGVAAVGDGDPVPVSDVCEALRRSAHRAAGAVLDLRRGSVSEALVVTEQAWHAGATTWLHVGRGAACDDGGLATDQLDLHEVLSSSDLITGGFEGAAAREVLAGCDVPRSAGHDPVDVVLTLSGTRQPSPEEALGTISVVVPTTGDLPALRRCLDSLRRQTLPVQRFDVVVASTSDVDPRPVLETTAGGLSVHLVAGVAPSSVEVAVARGAQAATGDHVLLLDDDSALGPRCLEEHLHAHRAHAGQPTVVVGRRLHRPQEPLKPVVRHALKLSRPWGADGPLRDGGRVDPSTVAIGGTSLHRSLAAVHVPRVVGLGGVDVGLGLAEATRRGDVAVTAVYAARATTCSHRPTTHDSLRRDQAALGVASEDLRQVSELAVGLGSSRAYLDVRTWAGSLRETTRAVQRFATEPLANLRLTEGRAGARGIDDLDRLVGADVRAAFALGELAAHRRWARSRTGSRVVVGVDASHALAGRVLTAFGARPGAVCVLGSAAPDPALGHRAAAVVVGRSLWECWDVDFVVGEPPEQWHPGMALPLWGAPPEDWAEWLCPAGGAGLLGAVVGDLDEVFVRAGRRGEC